MILSKFSNTCAGHLLAVLILACLDQARFQVLTQDASARRPRNDTRHATTTGIFNESYPLFGRNQSRANAKPISVSRALQQDRALRVQDKSLVDGSRGFQNFSRRMQDAGDQFDTRIPFWNIAHMINSIEEIEPALNEGANGIEVDISFDKQGIPTEAYHGFPCDCGRHCFEHEQFIKFLKHIGRITSPPSSSRLQLIVFDLKLKDLDHNQKEMAGDYMAANIYQFIYKPYMESVPQYKSFPYQPPIRIIVSINHVIDNILVRAFIDHMRKNHLDFMSQQVGFDVGMNDDLGEISAMWNEFNGATFNIWQGDGLTNCANVFRSLSRLETAISIRNRQGHFRKIYYWTADVLHQIRSVLNLGLDAILTNQPQRVLQVLDERDYKLKYRLATHYDDPFAQFSIQPSRWKVPSFSLSETVTNIQKTSENFVKTLPDGIAAALKKVTGLN